MAEEHQEQQSANSVGGYCAKDQQERWKGTTLWLTVKTPPNGRHDSVLVSPRRFKINLCSKCSVFVLPLGLKKEVLHIFMSSIRERHVLQMRAFCLGRFVRLPNTRSTWIVFPSHMTAGDTCGIFVSLQAVPHILTVSDTELLVLDPKSLQAKYNVNLGDITRISVTSLKDGIIVFHIRSVSVLSLKKNTCSQAQSRVRQVQKYT